jgi:nucleoside-diphosphate-sugar epimerase
MGASGWFGISAMNLLLQTEAQILPISSDGRRIEFRGVSFDTIRWDPTLIQAFNPTTVFDFAFLTREKLKQMSETSYSELNHVLIRRALWAIRLPSISRAIGFSSGAVGSNTIGEESSTKDLYATLKTIYEEKFLDLQSELAFTGRLVRAWSVSGKYCTKPESFAFASFVQQVQAGKIDIQSKSKVFRRYVSIEDVLTLALLNANTEPLVLETGGELVELGELAEKIVETLNPSAVIKRTLDLSLEPDCYHSDNTSWEAAVLSSNFKQTSLENQIRNCI